MKHSTLLFEIGVEEMPSSPLISAAAELEAKAREALLTAGLTFDDLKVFFTPRRIALIVTELSSMQADKTLVSKGPALKIARDSEGNFSPAALGFARGKGLSPEDLFVSEQDGVEYLFAKQEIKGLQTLELLPELLNSLISNLNWPKSMRWGNQDVKFIRPVRWILCLYGSELVPLTYGLLASETRSFGHRFLAPEAFEVSSLEDYKQKLKNAFVVLDADERRASILKELGELAQSYGEVLIDESVLKEVVNLAEYPNALVGSFDPEFLNVPEEMLLSAMSKHQRYFAIRKSDGTLSNHFIVVSNGDPKAGERIVAGHERVLRARLDDAHFFVKEDLNVSLDEWKLKLSSLMFQRDLGSLTDKTARIEALSAFMIDKLDLANESEILRGASLAKADLVTNAVVEFTELQGLMGAYYAKAQGETDLVADIIREHYLPRFAGDELPQSTEARIVALADKIDTTLGIILIGKAPTGSSDPFAIRRNIIGIIGILRLEPEINILELVEYAASLYKEAGIGDEKHLEDWRQFLLNRLSRIFRDEDFSHDKVEAILARFDGSIIDSYKRLVALKGFVESRKDEAPNLFTALARAANLHDGSTSSAVDHSLMGEYEMKLLTAVEKVEAQADLLYQAQNYAEILEQMAGLRAPVDDFFENLMVMDKDEAIRANRLAILKRLISVFDRFGDLTKVESSDG